MFAFAWLQFTDGLSWPSISFVVLIAALLLAGFILLRRYRSRRRLMQRVAELEALSAAGRAIVAAQLDINALSELIAREAGQVIDNRTFQIGLFDAQYYQILYWTINGRRQKTPRTFDLSDNGGIISWVRATTEPLLVRDFSRDMDQLPAQPRYISDTPPRSAIFIPLISGDETIGIIAAQSSQPNRFNEEDLRRLMILTNQAAAAIAHARLFDQERERAANLELVGQIGRQLDHAQSQTEIFKQVVTLTQNLFHFDLVSMFLIDPQNGEAVMRACSEAELLEFDLRLAPGQGIVGTAVARQQTIISNNTWEDVRYIDRPDAVQKTRAEMALPLIVNSELLGILDIQSSQSDVFTTAEKVTMEALAAEIAIAMNKLQQLALQREQAWLTTAQLQIAEAIGRCADLEEVATAVTRLTAMLVGVPLTGVLLWDEETAVYRGTAIHGTDHTFMEAFTQIQLGIGDWSSLDAVHVGQQNITTGNIPPWLKQATCETLPTLTEIVLMPISTIAQVLGVMITNNPAQITTPDTPTQLIQKRDELLYNITQQTARALEMMYLRQAQQEEAWVNTALFQVAAAVNSLTELNEILDTITRLVPMLVGVETCIILIWDEEQQVFHLGPTHGIDEMGRGLMETLELDQAEFTELTARTADSQTPTGTHYRVQLPSWLEKVMGAPSAYAFPLHARGQLVGAMVISSTATNTLSNRRLNILTGVAHQAATAVVNHQLYQEAAERNRLEQELNVAYEIQASLIPDGAPDIHGCNVASYWQAARQVSGDFYDFIRLADGTWGILIADVADKGMPAALFMALSRTILRAVAFSRSNPAQTLIRANEIINNDTQSDLFVTVFYAIWDPDKELLSYANGGHNPPLLLQKNGKMRLLTSGGIALGVLPQIDVQSNQIQFRPGETLLLYTDGVTEAMNEDYDEFGMSRLRLTARANKKQTAHGMMQAVTQAVVTHAGETPQFDDITLVVVKRSEE